MNWNVLLTYRWRPGMLAWLLHRLTGLGLAAYIVMHVFSVRLLTDAALESERTGNPDAWNAIYGHYSTPLIGVAEIALLAVVLFHAINGLRVLAVDFLGGARWHAKLTWAMWGVFAATFLPLATLMSIKLINGGH